jgi:hypothetical protein
MQHSFNVELAKEYGVLEAILINHLCFWIEKNKANDINYFDGNYWTYNSTKAFNKLLPYASERKIKYALKHLKDEEIIQTGNYNEMAYDRTLWYAFTKKGQSIVQKCTMERTKKDNGTCENVQPIPDIKPYIKPYINTDNNIIYSTIEEKTPKQEGKKQELENLPLENQPLEILELENQGQLNTNNKILNNKYNIINDINTNNKYTTTEKTPKKLIFGEYKRVKLTNEEYDKLCNDYTKDFIDNQIKLLDEYVESNNNKNKYSNYNLVLRKSIRENWFNDNKKNNTTKQQDGSSFDRILEEIYNGTIKLQ